VNKKAQYFVIILIISIVGLAFLYWYVEISNRFGYLYSTDNSSYKLEIQGFNLKLYSFNESEISESEFRNLKSRGVNLVIGPIYSVTGFKIYPYLEKYDLLSFSPTISSDRLLSLTNRIFSFTPTNEMQINAIVSFLKEKELSDLVENIEIVKKTILKDINDSMDRIVEKELCKIIVKYPKDVPKLRALKEIGVIYEHDIPFTKRYLIDSGIVPTAYFDFKNKKIS